MPRAAAAWLVLAVLAAGLAVVSGPAQAQTAVTARTLVSNTSQVGDDASNDFQAQSFRTGGVGGGYTITEIGIRLTIGFGSNTANPRVVLREDDGGAPGDLVATFANPSSFATFAVNTFTAPAGTTVDANTTYWVSIDEGISSSGQRLNVSLTSRDSQSGAAGWSIGNNRSHRSSETDSWDTSGTTSVRMQIRGHTTSAPIVAFPIPDQTATETVAFSYAFSATAFDDPNGDALSYTATRPDDSVLPSWLSFDAASRTFAGTPSVGGRLTVKVTASDGTYSVSDEFDIRIADADDHTPDSPPELVGIRFKERTGGGTVLELVHNEVFSNFADVRQSLFSISVNGGPGSAPRLVSFGTGARALDVDSASEVSSGDTVTVSYTPRSGSTRPPLQDLSGNVLPAFSRTFNAPHVWWSSRFKAKTLDGHCRAGDGAVGWSDLRRPASAPCRQGLVARDLLPRDIELGGVRYPTDLIHVQKDEEGGRLTVQYARSLEPALVGRSLALRVGDETFWFSEATQSESGRRYTWDNTGLDWEADDWVSFSYTASVFDNEGPVNEPPAYASTTHLNCAVYESRTFEARSGLPGGRPCDWQVLARDPEGETLTYSVDAGEEWADELFYVDSDAQVRVRDGVYLDYETAPRKTTRNGRSHHYWLRVRATDPGGLSDTRMVGISVLDQRLEPESGEVLAGGTAIRVRMPERMRRGVGSSSYVPSVSVFEVVVRGGTSRTIRSFTLRDNDQTFELGGISPSIALGQTVEVRYLPEHYGYGSLRTRSGSTGTAVPPFNLVLTREAPRSTEASPVTLTLGEGLPRGHDGSARVAFELAFSEAPVDATEARIAALVSATNATVHAARRVEAGNDLVWRVELAPSAAANITVFIAATADCTEANAICSETGGMLENGTAFPIPYAAPIVATFHELPEAHNGTAEVSFEIGFDPEPAGLTAETVKANLTVTSGATLGDVSAVTEGSSARWRVSVTPPPGEDLGIVLGTTRDCDAANAVCTGLGGRLTTVPPPRTVPYQAGFSQQQQIVPPEPIVAAFADVPTSHDGTTQVSVDITFAPEPAGLTADELKANLTAYNGTVGEVTQTTAGDNARWRVAVTPTAAESLRVVVNPTVGCEFANAICTATGARLETAAETAIAYAVPLTVAFVAGHEPPTEHDGTTAFTFRISFSEDLGAGFAFKKLRSAFETLQFGNGTLRLTPRTKRLEKGKSQHWQITVKPNSRAAKGSIRISLEPADDCASSNSICTPDGRKLTNALPLHMVLGPPSLSVADASTTEAPGATVDFEVTLSRAATETVTVDYQTRDKTATAGPEFDYTAASGTLTFAPGETTKTISVAVRDDDNEENTERFGLKLTNANGANTHITDSWANGHIND